MAKVEVKKNHKQLLASYNFQGQGDNLDRTYKTEALNKKKVYIIKIFYGRNLFKMLVKWQIIIIFSPN